MVKYLLYPWIVLDCAGRLFKIITIIIIIIIFMFALFDMIIKTSFN